MEKWKQKFEDSNKKTAEDIHKFQKSYNYNFASSVLEEAKVSSRANSKANKTYSKFCTVDPILCKGNASTVATYL